METITALSSKLKAHARVIAQQIRRAEVSGACWIDGNELARLRQATGLDLQPDRISGGFASGAYLQNLYAQCDRDERRVLRRAVNGEHIPSPEQIRRLIRNADQDFAWGLDETQVALVAMAVIEAW